MRNWVLLLFPLFFFFNTAFSQIEHTDFEQFTSKHGLSHNTIINVFIDSNGFIWLSTMDGLSRFDVNGFTTFKNQDFPELPSNFIHSVLESGKDTLWIATRDEGLARFIPSRNEFKTVRPQEGEQKNGRYSFIKLIHQISASQFLMYFSNGNWAVCNFDGTSVQLQSNLDIPIDESIRIRLIPNSKDYLITSNSAFYLAKLDVETRQLGIKKLHQTSSKNELIAGLIEFENELYIAFSNSGLQKIQSIDTERNLIKWKLITKWIKPNFKALAVQVHKNSLFVANHTLEFLEINLNSLSQDLHVIKGESLYSNQKLSYFNKIEKDEFGTIWAATWGSGILKIPTKSSFNVIPALNKNGKTYNRFNLGILEDRFETIWLLSDPRLVRFYPKTGKQIHFDTNSPFSFSNAWQIRESSTGIWIATDNEGINFIPSSSYSAQSVSSAIQKFTEASRSLRSNRVAFTLEDHLGRLWISHHQAGIQVFSSEKAFIEGQSSLLAEFSSSSKDSLKRIPDESARFLFQEKNGSIWAGTFKAGIVQLSDSSGTLSVFYPDSSHGLRYPHYDMRGIYEAKDQSFWISTYGGGIIHWDRNLKTSEFINTSTGLSNNFTYGFLNENDDFLWIPTNTGLNKLSLKSKEIQVFTDADGLLNNEFNTGGLHKGKSGMYYVGGVDGVNYFKPSDFNFEPIIPKTSITSVKTFNKELIEPHFFKQKNKIPFEDHFLTFTFTSSDLTEPTKNRYIYRLIGSDTTWIDSFNRTSTSYSNISPGEYTFEVLASSSDRTWSTEPARFSFEIVPPFWMTTWFKLIASFLFVSVFTFFIRYISTQKLKQQLVRLESEKKIQLERERISRDLHDHVGNQLANIMSGIDLMKKYAEHNQIERAKEWHSTVKDDVRYTMQQLRETIWTLSKTEINLSDFSDRLDTYFRTRATDELHISTELKEREGAEMIILSPAISLNVFRIIQEAVQNSLKYSKADLIKVELMWKTNQLTFSVMDNGQFIKREKNYEGFGIKNMKSRAEEIGAEIEILGDEKGTQVVLSLNIS